MMVKLKVSFGLFLFVASSLAAGEAIDMVRASSAGAKLDSDLIRGGGTNDTRVLQRLLDHAKSGKAVHLILDGPALVSGLDVYGNTVIECTAGGGLFLQDGSSRAILRNAHRSRGAIIDEHIEIRGCFFNGNRKHQPSADIRRPDLAEFPFSSNKEKDGTYISGLQFLGVNYLNIHDVTIWNYRAFGSLIANASYVDIRNVIVDNGGGPDANLAEYAATDGLHFKGPLRYVSIDSIKLRAGDDGIAFNANDYETDDITTRNDFGPYVGQGPIADVTVNNVIFMPGQFSGIRILSTNERIDRILINDVTGVTRFQWLTIGSWVNRRSFGNVGNVTIDNVSVEQQQTPQIPTDVVRDFVRFNGRIDTLSIHHLTARTSQNQRIFTIDSEVSTPGTTGDSHTDIGMMDVSANVIDPSFAAEIIDLGGGSHIRRLRLALNWQGSVPDEGRNPIALHGGSIDQLVWVGTPPSFIGAHAVPRDASSVDVAFNQELRGNTSGTGAKVLVNGRSVRIERATLQPGGMTVRYQLASSIRPNDSVAWAYDASVGDLQNLDGSYLLSVSEKKVQIDTFNTVGSQP